MAIPLLIFCKLAKHNVSNSSLKFTQKKRIMAHYFLQFYCKKDRICFIKIRGCLLGVMISLSFVAKFRRRFDLGLVEPYKTIIGKFKKQFLNPQTKWKRKSSTPNINSKILSMCLGLLDYVLEQVYNI